ncbi:MAG: hypothetical protein RSB12_01380 [Peptostreptococcaceae bacterium]
MIMVAIYASIISQEFENDEDLAVLARFLIALGEELDLAVEVRLACKSDSNSEVEAELANCRSYIKTGNSKKKRIRKKKVRKNNIE